MGDPIQAVRVPGSVYGHAVDTGDDELRYVPPLARSQVSRERDAQLRQAQIDAARATLDEYGVPDEPPPPPPLEPWRDPPPPNGGRMSSLSSLAIVNALLGVVVIAATVAFAYNVRGFTGTDLTGVYLYVLGHASGQLVPTSTAVKPPGA